MFRYRPYIVLVSTPCPVVSYNTPNVFHAGSTVSVVELAFFPGFPTHFFIEGNAELKNAVTNISHDLRTPLTAICGYLDLLEQEEKSTTIERYIEIIRNRADLLTELIEELFRYSVIISGERLVVREPIAINGILEESIAAFYTTLNKRGIVPNTSKDSPIT